MTPAKGYTEMKDSGIEWISEIPAHWGILRGKNVLRLLERPVKPDDDVITCFRDGEVTLRKNRREEGFTNSLKEIGYQGVEPGDLIVHGMDGFAGSIGISDSRGKASPVLNVMDSNQNKRYLMYYLRAMAYKDVFMALSTGIRVRSCDLRWNKLSVFPFLIPTSHEQSAIAAYLDTQCAKIDEIIAQAKASIEDYKQWKASIIYEAVTKGLDPNVEMKDSGVEGIVEIPNHWRTLRIKYVSSLDAICDTSHISPDDVVTFAPMECIRNDIRIPKVATKSKDNGTYSSFIDGDIAIAKVTPCFENGNICIMDNLENGYAFGSSELFSLRPYGIDRRYFFYCLQTPTFIDGGAATMTGVGGLKRVSSYYMKNALIPIPPLEEQRTIAKFLDKKTALIATLISEKETLIDDLESYKKSLIYETVTGKGRVC